MNIRGPVVCFSGKSQREASQGPLVTGAPMLLSSNSFLSTLSLYRNCKVPFRMLGRNSGCQECLDPSP